LFAVIAAQSPELTGAVLETQTNAAYDKYVGRRDWQIRQERNAGKPFLIVDRDRNKLSRLRAAGTVLVEEGPGGARHDVEGGLIHDWRAAVFVKGTTLKAALDLVRDYDNHASIYAPEVVQSKTLSRSGDEYRVRLRLLKKKVITAVLDTDHEVKYVTLAARRAESRARTTRIVEVVGHGTADEKTLPPGRDHGFLWRLDTWWRFEERDGGVYIECDAVSLSRGIPFLVSPIVSPIVRSLPRESLEKTLEATRAALAARATRTATGPGAPRSGQ
jgi:hypothetical protein